MQTANQALDVTVLGAGRMGSALIRAFRAAGRSVAVWNRDYGKAEALTPIGVQPFKDIGEAVGASSLIVVCVSDYATSSDLIAALAKAGAISGKTVVQLTTGTPAESEDFAQALDRAGARSLDGAIMAYPKQVGENACRILLSGEQAVYDRVAPILNALGRTMFMGARPGAASAADGALLFYSQATAFAYFQSAALLMAQGYDWDGLADLIGGNEITADSLKSWEAAIASGVHTGSEATLDVHYAAFKSIVAAADASGSRHPLMSAVESQFERAVALGHGGDELSGAFETMRPGRAS